MIEKVNNCPPDTVVDVANKICKFGLRLQWTQVAPSITNAKEITMKGDQVYILKTDNSLHKFNTSSLAFDPVNSPTGKSLIDISLYKEMLFACTADNLIYYLSNSVWVALNSVIQKPCVKISINDIGGIYILNTTTTQGDIYSIAYKGFIIDSYLRTTNAWVAGGLYNDGNAIGNCAKDKQYSIIKLGVSASGYTFKLGGNGGTAYTRFLNTENRYMKEETISNSDLSISCVIPQRVFFSYFKVLYYYSGNDALQWNPSSGGAFDLKTEIMTNGLSVVRVAATRSRPPWIIANGKIYQANCSPPYENFEESGLCVLTCPSHLQLNSSNKTCWNCKSFNKFYLAGTDCFFLTNNLCTDIIKIINL